MTNDEKFLETLLINGEDEHTEFKTAKNSIPKDVLELSLIHISEPTRRPG